MRRSITPTEQQTQTLLSDQLFQWSMLWMKVGVLIAGAVLAISNRWLPDLFAALGYLVGALTGLAFLYIMHYSVVMYCGRTARWICLPLVALIDILAVGGTIALLLRSE